MTSRLTLRAVVATLTMAAALAACGPNGSGWMSGAPHTGPGMGPGMGGGIGWGRHAFNSNGERIYFTATSERDTPIEPSGGPADRGWMMMHGRAACVSCHGVDGKGGRRDMGMMGSMEAKDIRWSTLSKEFNEAQFARVVREGVEPDGKVLAAEMPRWRISDPDLADLVAYLKTLP